jgi:carbon monoxide dehydrogenase subunit G
MDYTTMAEDGNLMGGDAVRVVRVPIEDAIAVLEQPDVLWILMPRVVSLTRIAGTDDDQVIDARHAVGPFEGGYAMRFIRRRAGRSSFEAWFWVDPAYPADLDLAWGNLRLIPFGRDRTLLSYQVRIKLSPGLLKLLASGRIRRAALSIPDRAKALIEDRARFLPGRERGAASEMRHESGP